MRFVHRSLTVLVGIGLFLNFVAALPLSAHEIPSKAPGDARERKNPVKRDEAAIAAGGNLYMKLCLECHGPSGKGDGPAAASLPHRPLDLTRVLKGQTDGEIFWKITRGGGAMSSYEKTLIETERWQVVHYLRSLATPAERRRR